MFFIEYNEMKSYCRPFGGGKANSGKVVRYDVINRTKVLTIPQLLMYLGFTARQYYFTHFEPSESEGVAKTGDPQEKNT